MLDWTPGASLFLVTQKLEESLVVDVRAPVSVKFSRPGRSLMTKKLTGESQSSAASFCGDKESLGKARCWADRRLEEAFAFLSAWLNHSDQLTWYRVIWVIQQWCGIPFRKTKSNIQNFWVQAFQLSWSQPRMTQMVGGSFSHRFCPVQAAAGQVEGYRAFGTGVGHHQLFFACSLPGTFWTCLTAQVTCTRNTPIRIAMCWSQSHNCGNPVKHTWCLRIQHLECKFDGDFMRFSYVGWVGLVFVQLQLMQTSKFADAEVHDICMATPLPEAEVRGPDATEARCKDVQTKDQTVVPAFYMSPTTVVCGTENEERLGLEFSQSCLNCSVHWIWTVHPAILLSLILNPLKVSGRFGRKWSWSLQDSTVLWGMDLVESQLVDGHKAKQYPNWHKL